MPVVRLVRRFMRVLGRRGAILGGYGTVWLLYGYALLVEPTDPRGLDLLLAAWPMQVWAAVWIAAGLVAIVFAFLPQGLDVPGFVALVVVVLPWMLAYFASWWPLGTSARGWVGALIWAAITAPVIVVAGWPEPSRERIEHNHEHER